MNVVIFRDNGLDEEWSDVDEVRVVHGGALEVSRDGRVVAAYAPAMWRKWRCES